MLMRLGPIGIGLMMMVGVALATTGTASAQGSAGLVLETSGSINPPIRSYTEIPGGTALSVSDSAKLVFVHYQTCKTVTVVGGTVTITPGSYITKGGKQSDERTPCPRKVSVRGGGELGGVVYRSVSANRGLTLQTEAAFVVSGPRASDFAVARISREGAVTVTVPPTTVTVLQVW